MEWDVCLLIMSWHLFMGVSLMNFDMPSVVLSPVHNLAIAGAYLLKIWKVVDGLFSLSAYNDVIEVGSMNRLRCCPRNIPL